MIKKILTIPNKILDTVCVDFENFNDAGEVAQNLIDTLSASKIPGAGLAAPQIGIKKRIILARKFYFQGQEEKHKDVIMINPVIVKTSKEKTKSVEACLSIPKIFGFVQRHKQITIEYLDLSGKKHKIGAGGYFSFIIQHEIDHLNGILFTSKLVNNKIYTEKEIEKMIEKK